MNEYELLKLISKSFGHNGFTINDISNALSINVNKLNKTFSKLKDNDYIEYNETDQMGFVQNYRISLLGLSFLKQTKKDIFWFYFEKINSLTAIIISLLALAIALTALLSDLGVFNFKG